MGNLFYRGATPMEIESMTFSQLRYWNRWHEVIAKADREPKKNG
jgi:hypothetical protein